MCGSVSVCVCAAVSVCVYRYIYIPACMRIYMHSFTENILESSSQREGRGGGLGSSTIFKNLMSLTPRRKWYLTTGRRSY